MKMRRTLLVFLSVVFGFLMTACKSCTEQHDPRPAQERFKLEEKFAKEEVKLNPDGTIPAPKAVEGEGPPKSPGQAKYDQFCAACHGENGKADGPGALALNPRPRNFADAAWQAKVDDAHITKVIAQGGASVGLSPTMAPWGGVLSPDDIKEVVKWVRQFKDAK